jgi:hypothetical protein
VLSVEEMVHLKEMVGLWPEYPRTLVKLAREHNLVIPGMMLPGPREMWDRFRTASMNDEAVPAVPQEKLLELAEELSPQERLALQLSPAEPRKSRERLQEEWKRRHPREWQQMIQVERQKQLQKLHLTH